MSHSIDAAGLSASGGMMRRAHGQLVAEVRKELEDGAMTPTEVTARLLARGFEAGYDTVCACMSAQYLKGRLARLAIGLYALPTAPISSAPQARGQYDPLAGVHPGRVLTLGAHRAVPEGTGYRCRLCQLWEADRFDLALAACCPKAA